MSLDELLHEKPLEGYLAYTECSTNVTYHFAQWFINLQGWQVVEISTENLINPVKDKISTSKHNLKFQYPQIILVSLVISILQRCTLHWLKSIPRIILQW